MKQVRIWMLAAILVLCGTATVLAQVNYVERSWDETNKKVTETTKSRAVGEYTALSTSDANGWIPLYSGWYVVTNDVSYKVLSVQGDVHLIIADGKRLAVQHIKVEGSSTATNSLSIYSGEAGTGAINCINTYDVDNAAAIGGGNGASAGNINIHGCYIYATGNNNGAGIGGGMGRGFYGTLNIYGGHITAKGGTNGAGIGSGEDNSSDMAGFIHIYGGHITATGNGLRGAEGGAGIGGGRYGQGAHLQVHGGTVKAVGSTDAAAIGGGYNGNNYKTIIDGGTVNAIGTIGGGDGSGITAMGKGNGGEITINGGTVTTSKGDAGGGAGIGCGNSGESATITINGGTVTAVANSSSAAGIGGGGNYSPQLNISITGGTVTTTGYQGIGPGEGLWGEKDYKGTLSITGGTVIASGEVRAIGGDNGVEFASSLMTIGDDRMVNAGDDANNLETFAAGLRISACVWRKNAKIESCTHTGATYTVSGTTPSDTHTKHCAYCTTAFTAETHDFSDSKCSVCGVSGTSYTVTIYLPKTSTTTDGDYDSSTSYNMVANETFNLPPAPTANTPGRMEFAGWLVGTPSNGSFIADDGETLLSEESEYTIKNNISLTARYRYLNISLADADDNTETVVKNLGMMANSVTLTGRTFYKDGKWNTLCLPFSIDNFTGTPLEGAIVKTLSSTEFDSTTGTLTLNFSATNLTTIDAGKPYIVKWESGTNIENPVFSNVSIDRSSVTTVSTTYADFKGIYSPYSIEGEDKSLLYLGRDNTLYYPNAAMTIGACRAYFTLNNGHIADDLPAQTRALVMNFGNGETTSINEELRMNNKECTVTQWYTISGVKLDSKPTAKGMYIMNGKKIVIK